MTNHTPTPWKLATNGWDVLDQENKPLVTPRHTREIDEIAANQAFIVRAVNSHSELLKLIKDINYAFYAVGTPKAMKEVMSRSKAIIAKAEGK